MKVKDVKGIVVLVTYSTVRYYSKELKMLLPLRMPPQLLPIDMDELELSDELIELQIPNKPLEKGRIGIANTIEDFMDFINHGDLLHFIKTGNIRKL